MSIEANKALIRRLNEAMSARDYDVVDDLVAADFVNHPGGGAKGVEAWKQIFRAIDECFPDFEYTEEDLFAEGDKVALVATLRGTHRASTLPFLRGIEPKGTYVEWHYIHVFRIADGRIAEHWARTNGLEVVRTLSE